MRGEHQARRFYAPSTSPVRTPAVGVIASARQRELHVREVEIWRAAHIDHTGGGAMLGVLSECLLVRGGRSCPETSVARSLGRPEIVEGSSGSRANGDHGTTAATSGLLLTGPVVQK